MRLDTGMVVIIVAVLLFYLRLILIQRERAKRLRAAQNQRKAKQKPVKGHVMEADASTSLSILSTRPLDWAIAGAGLVAVVAGVLLNRGWIPWPGGQLYWWLPVALGIVAFSWAFR